MRPYSTCRMHKHESRRRDVQSVVAGYSVSRDLASPQRLKPQSLKATPELWLSCCLDCSRP